MRLSPLACALPLASSLAALADAPPHTITVLIREGNDAADVGLVTTVDTVAVNNSGTWLIDVDTNNPNTAIDHPLLRNGTLYLQEGQSLAAPAGATIGTFDDLTLNNFGNSGWNWFLANTGGTTNDSGVFFNDTLIFQESAISTASGFTPGTPYIGFFGAKINDSNQIMLVASVDDPAITSTVDRAIVRIDYNAATHAFTETVIAKEGDLLTGMALPVADFGTNPQDFAFNNSGTVMYGAEVAGGTSDGIFVGDTLVVREGLESVVPGRNWEILNDRAMDLSNNGDYIFRANITGDTLDDEMLVKNTQVFMREGQTLPAITPFTLTGFGTGPVLIDDSGNVVWYGTWNNPDTTQNKGLFWNSELLIQDNVTQIEGQTVTLRGIQDGFAMSDNGQYIIVRVQFPTSVDAALLISFAPQCGTADFNCDGDVGTDADIEAFFACIAGTCPQPPCNSTADFNGDGDVGTDADIEAFFRVLAGGPCV